MRPALHAPGATGQMRAVSQDHGGGPEVLHLIQVARPAPGPTEVLVRVHAAGVNPTDWKTRARGRFLVGVSPPFTLGYDVSGVVAELGDGVTTLAVGDEVFGMPRFPHPAGAYADYIVAPSRPFARKPATMDHLHAGGLPLAGLTAWQALVDTAGVSAGQRVLVHAAAGGVGHLAVQIAKARGAYVYGTATAAKHNLLRSLGVDEPIDYTTTDFGHVATALDAVLDPIGGTTTLRSLAALRDGGTLITLPPLDAQTSARLRGEHRVTAARMLVEPDRAGLQALGSLADAGALRVKLDTVLPLTRVREAHIRGESGRASGKIVLSVASDDG